MSEKTLVPLKFKQLVVGQFQFSGGYNPGKGSYAIIGLDTKGRVWRYGQSEDIWLPYPAQGLVGADVTAKPMRRAKSKKEGKLDVKPDNVKKDKEAAKETKVNPDPNLVPMEQKPTSSTTLEKIST